MTVKEILKYYEEFKEEKKKTEYVPHYYKRNGKMLRRSYDDEIETERYKFLFLSSESPLRKEKIFTCECCNKKVAFFDLERWACDFDNDEYICSMCYENEMGEDL